MTKRQLSVIVPYCNEYPQIYFTICNLRCELEQSDIDWEIITIANKNTDQGFERVSRIQSDRVRALRYDEKLSHWCAKNAGVLRSTGEVLFFIDSHCILTKNALVNMYKCYIENREEINGSLHLPILYMNEKNGRELEYKLIANITENNKIDPSNPKNTAHNLHYSFTRYKHKAPFHRVSCMSNCGMMISRDILVDKLGMWPWALGIYGGGENFFNFTLAMMGYHVNVFSRPNAVHHYAEKRGYAWNYDNWIKNRIIAAYMFGGSEWSKIFALNLRGRREVLARMWTEVTKECLEHRKKIEPYIKFTPQEWVEQEAASGRFQGIYR